ncbi:hypothetical protein [Nitrospira sp. Nam80]
MPVDPQASPAWVLLYDVARRVPGHGQERGQFNETRYDGSEPDRTGLLNNQLTRKRIETAVERELTKKGLTQVGLKQHPDLSFTIGWG